MSKYFPTSIERFSKEIDDIIEKVEHLKSKIPDHERGTDIRKALDVELRQFRFIKKKALQHWRVIKKDPKITP